MPNSNGRREIRVPIPSAVSGQTGALLLGVGAVAVAAFFLFRGPSGTGLRAVGLPTLS